MTKDEEHKEMLALLEEITWQYEPRYQQHELREVMEKADKLIVKIKGKGQNDRR